MKPRILTVVMLLLTVGLCTDLLAGVGVRAGVFFPRGDFGDFASTATRVEINADFKILPIPAISTIVSVSSVRFGSEESKFPLDEIDVAQKSKVNTTSLGIGLRLAPPSLIISPFGEALVRVSKVEQDYSNDEDGPSSESSTKFGYQLNLGLSFSMAPKLSLEAGVSWMTVPGSDLKWNQKVYDIDLQAMGIFGGLRLGL